jgi:DNA invertase Pin-like site-specific DNA recombinase
MVKAFAYLRVSGKGQVDGDGFPRQLAAIKAYAEKNDIKIVKVFREEGVSGTKDMENRPAFAELVTALASNGVKLVLVENLSRLARDLMIQESILSDFQRNGYEVRSVAEPDLCSEDPTRTLMRQMLGAFSQYEKSMIVIKLRGARLRKKAATGRCEGAKPFGAYEGEDIVLERILTLRNDGYGFDKIASTLNIEGHKPRRGEKWYGSAVNSVITSRNNAQTPVK